MTAGNPRNYTRDPNGNITSSTSHDGSGAPNTTYEWDAADRLTAINIGTHRTEIQYDGLGRRVHLTEKDSGNITNERRFLWCGNEICEERDASGGTVTKRFFGQGEQRLGGTDAGLYFYTRDHLGSVRELTDANGTVRARYDYDLWGQRTKLAGNLDCDFGFTGFYFHALSGLNFSRTRTYDSTIGKWISVDPIGERGGMNLYRYVNGNPLSKVDANGLSFAGAGQALAVGGEVLGGEELGGWGVGGNFNPIVDVILGITLVGVTGLVLYELFKPEENGKPQSCPKDQGAATNPNTPDPNDDDPTSPKQLKIDDNQLGHKFGEHMDSELPGYRTPQEYRDLANTIYNDSNATRTTLPSGEIQIQSGNNLLRIAPDGSFRSLYPLGGG